MRALLLTLVFGILALASATEQEWSAEALASADFVRRPGGLSGGAVLDVGPAGSWRDQAVTTPTVIFDGRQYRMWFTGVEKNRPRESAYLYRTAVGAAVSNDGRSWSLLNDGEPVLSQGPYLAFDQHSVGHPMVLHDGAHYLMWYGAADGLDATRDIRIERIGLAQSADGVRWTRLNAGKPVIDIGPPGSADSIQATGPSVVRTAGGYMMWYGAYNGEHSIVAARSADGISWTKVPVTGLDASPALGPSVLHAGGAFYMVYSTPIAGRWTLVAATSRDGLGWTRIRDGAAILAAAPRVSFDAAAPGQNAGVHPSQFLIEDDLVRAWYAGEDPAGAQHQRIGMMEAVLPTRPARAISVR